MNPAEVVISEVQRQHSSQVIPLLRKRIPQMSLSKLDASNRVRFSREARSLAPSSLFLVNRRGHGRPPKDVDKLRSESLLVRLEGGEKEAFKEVAKLAGVSVAAWGEGTAPADSDKGIRQGRAANSVSELGLNLSM
jgi:hypothetical protein